MRLLNLLGAAAALVAPALASNGKAVFAHFIVGNVLPTYDFAQWLADVEAAKASGLTGFVLNMAPPYDNTLRENLDNAFAAAELVGDFENMIMFDYLGGGRPWDADDVVAALQRYGSHSAYFQYNDLPLVSTFEGVDNIGDWTDIKAEAPCFFVPDWTSIGPYAFATHNVTDGAFSWNMWPAGANDMTAAPDLEWKNVIGNKKFMMGVSPWFYTNLPQWNKAWVWRGDDLWADRWEQVQAVNPDFIQVVTWNDYGESHYVGPIRPATLPPDSDLYVDDMSHNHWRDLLPYYIERYLHGSATVTTEKLTWWYRLAPGAAGTTVATGNNCPSPINLWPYQECVDPNLIAQDKVFFTALVAELPATICVQIGNGTVVEHAATAVGPNHFSQDFDGNLGTVKFTLKRNGVPVLAGEGKTILAAPANGVTNYNAYAGGVPNTYPGQL